MRRPSESGRPLFDPARMRATRDESASADSTGPDALVRSGGDETAPLTVTRLNQMLRGAVTAAFPSTIHVVGELSNVSRAGAGHTYFTLKDGSSEVRCVLWRSDAVRVKFEMTDGLEVVVSGKLDVYEPRGQIQLYAKRLQPRGVGALELAFRQLKERLANEGLFDAARKRPIPTMPRTIGVVTSPTGAAIQDILTTIERRFPKVRVITAGVRVQGDEAAKEVAAAIRRFNDHAVALGGVDVLIVGRGGGSLEDLWAFNEEVVARAILASKIPIVSAVGHEVDFSIADFVADLRAPTPTAAAEMVVPVLYELTAGIDGLELRIRRGFRAQLDSMRSRLNAVARTPWFRDPVGAVRRWHQRLDELSGRLRFVLHRAVTTRRRRVGDGELRLMKSRPVVQLSRRRLTADRASHRLLWSMREQQVSARRAAEAIESRMRSASPRHLVQRERDRVESIERRLKRSVALLMATVDRRLITAEGRLAAASPDRVLARGFSITRRMRGKTVIRASEDVKEGDRIVTETADGEIHSRVVDSRQGELFQ